MEEGWKGERTDGCSSGTSGDVRWEPRGACRRPSRTVKTVKSVGSRDLNIKELWKLDQILQEKGI